MEKSLKMDKAFTILKALLTAGGPIAIAMTMFLGFGSEDANRIVTAVGSIGSVVGLFLFVGPRVLTPNEMTGLAKGLLAGGGAVSVLLTSLLNLDSAIATKYLEIMSGMVSAIGMTWTVVSSSDTGVLKQANKVEGVEAVHINPDTASSSVIAAAVSSSPETAKVQLLIPEPSPPPPVDMEELTAKRTYSEM